MSTWALSEKIAQLRPALRRLVSDVRPAPGLSRMHGLRLSLAGALPGFSAPCLVGGVGRLVSPEPGNRLLAAAHRQRPRNRAGQRGLKQKAHLPPVGFLLAGLCTNRCAPA